MMRGRTRIAGSLLALAACLALSPAAFAQEAAVGQPAPDFTLVDETGTSHTLSQYRGQIVVLEWTNPDCPFVQRCYTEDRMQQTSSALATQGVVWLAVDSTHDGTAEVSANWKTEHGFTYPTLQDRDGTVGHAYGARTTPHMYVIDAAGVLRYAGAYDDNPRGSTEAPTNYVNQTVTALLAGQEPPVTTTDPWGCTVKYADEE